MNERAKEKVYSEAEIGERLQKELPKWSYENGWIRRKYKTHGWKSTLMVINTVGHLAEAAGKQRRRLESHIDRWVGRARTITHVRDEDRLAVHLTERPRSGHGWRRQCEARWQAVAGVREQLRDPGAGAANHDVVLAVG